MKPKTKSLLFLLSFALCALLYHQLEVNDVNVETLKNSDFTTIEIMDVENNLSDEIAIEKDLE